MFLRWSLAIFLALSTLGCGDGNGGVNTDRLPNVVLIFIDDMGYADIGPFGAEGYETPHIDRLAAEGRMFTDFYVSAPVCSASRAGLLTGAYNVRVGINGALRHSADFGLNQDETTLAEIFKQKDYATGIFGKWHLGHHPVHLPMNHGFDEFFGLPYSNDMWNLDPIDGHEHPTLPLLEGGRVIDTDVTPEDQEGLTTRFTEYAVDFIDRNKDRPFFLYVPHAMVHIPLFVSDKFRGKSERGIFGDVVMEVDWSVGQIMGALREHGLDDNTMVIFTTDNGPWLAYGSHAGSAKPLREGKITTFDGGVRTPTIMRWPGHIPQGTTSDEPAMTIDLLPTLANLIGAELPEKQIDGMDIWPLISAEPGATSPQEAYFFYRSRGLQAMRMGNWKLHFPHGYITLGDQTTRTDGLPITYERAEIGLSLFDLAADPGESVNVAEQHPEVVSQMEQIADRMRADLGDALTDQEGPGRRPAGELEPGDLRFNWVPGKPIDPIAH